MFFYKGPDRVMASIVQDESNTTINEISNFIDARYISASEACWRIFHYELHNRSPAIQRLAINLPN